MATSRIAAADQTHGTVAAQNRSGIDLATVDRLVLDMCDPPLKQLLAAGFEPVQGLGNGCLAEAALVAPGRALHQTKECLDQGIGQLAKLQVTGNPGGACDQQVAPAGKRLAQLVLGLSRVCLVAEPAQKLQLLLNTSCHG
jgi:hypothetical protein